MFAPVPSKPDLVAEEHGLLAFWRVSRTAGWLLAPYLAWVSFAAALNLALWRLNP